MKIEITKKIKDLINMIKENAKNVYKNQEPSKEVDIILNSSDVEIASACIDCMVDVIVKKVGPKCSKSKIAWSLMVDSAKKISNNRDKNGS